VLNLKNRTGKSMLQASPESTCRRTATGKSLNQWSLKHIVCVISAMQRFE
jgi:hypothetical protein